MREAVNQIKYLDLKLEKISTKLNYLLSTIPNLVSNNVPYGKNEDENEVIKSVGEIKNFDFASDDLIIPEVFEAKYAYC